MKITIDFGKIVEGAPADGGGDVPAELMPLVSAYAWKPRKGDAVMDFVAEIVECEKTCESACDDANVKCMAAVNGGRGVVLVANPAKASVPLKMECKGMRVKSVRLIDGNRTDVRVPMLAVLPPLSVALMECGE